MNVSRIALYVLLFFVFLCAAGCESPREALMGYDMNQALPLDRAITDDVQNFIRSQKIPFTELIKVKYGENRNGRHAVVIYQEFSKSLGTKGKTYILFYNKNDGRIKVKSWNERTNS
jgi:hypothetical protein